MVAAPGAYAQSPDERPVRRVEVGFGGGVLGGAALGALDANLRANALPPDDYTLFATETRFAAAPFAELQAGVALTRRFGVEARVAFGRPELRTSVSADVEGAPPLTVVERVDQYLIEGAVIVMFDELRLGGAVPFATAGAEYLRQLHERGTVVEEGHVYNVGGGMKFWLFHARRVR